MRPPRCSVCRNPDAKRNVNAALVLGCAGTAISRALGISAEVINRHKRHFTPPVPIANGSSAVWLTTTEFPCVVGHGNALHRHLSGHGAYVHKVLDHSEAEWSHYRLSRIVLAGMTDTVLDEMPEEVLARNERVVLTGMRRRMTEQQARARQKVEAEVAWYETGFRAFVDLYAKATKAAE